VLEAKRAMTACLREGLRRTLVVQGPLTCCSWCWRPWIAAELGLDGLQLGIMRCGLVGALLHVLCLFGGIVLLYFDRRRGGRRGRGGLPGRQPGPHRDHPAGGPRSYGLGYPLAALLGCAWAYHRLEQTLDDLEYLTFGAQPMAPETSAVESSSASRLMAPRSAGEATLVAALLGLLAAAIVYPLLQVLSVAFLDGGVPTLRPLAAFLGRRLPRGVREHAVAGVLAVVIGSVIAVPLALLTVRYRFPGRTLVTVLGVLPLVDPPFVGAVAFQQILGQSGAVNLLCRRTRVSRSSSWRAFPGGAGAEPPLLSLHPAQYRGALAGLDRSLEEAARTWQLGAPLFRRVLLPLALPATRRERCSRSSRESTTWARPSCSNYTKLLAPQAYVRVTTIGLTDVDGLRDLRHPGGPLVGALRSPRRSWPAASSRRSAGAGSAAGDAGPAGRAGGVGARRAAVGAGLLPHSAFCCCRLPRLEPHALPSV